MELLAVPELLLSEWIVFREIVLTADVLALAISKPLPTIKPAAFELPLMF
jgi:hypothetical protein